jgi:PAS domain S-box-containing protein
MEKRIEDAPSSEPPFGLDLSMAVIARSARIAKGLFTDVEASVTLIDQGGAWQSFSGRAISLDDDPAAARVLAAGELLWIEDARQEPILRDHRFVTGPPYGRFYAGAPIRLADGATIGVLCVVSGETKSFDADKATCLQDLADAIADDWRRAQAARASERAERERDAARATLGELITALPLSIVMTDHDLRVVTYSHIWARSLGLDGGDVRGQSIFDLTDGFYRRWEKAFHQSLAGERFTGQRVKVPTLEGGTSYLQSEVTPWYGSDGEVAGIIVASDDVTELVEALKQVARNEERLNMALSLADLHVFELDYTRQELFKAGAEDTFFMRPQTYQDLYRDIKVTVDPRDRQMVADLWNRHTDQGEPFRAQYRIDRSDDREIWVEGTAALHTNADGQPLRLMGAIRNITERKLAEQAVLRAKDEAEAANVAKSTFLATMSHEIRTPLNGVLGMAQVMAAEALSPVQRERVRIIQQSGETLLAILNDVLDLSKIEAGKLELEEAPFDAGDLARGAHGAFSGVAEQKDLRFELTVEPQAKGVYLGDGTRVRQILYNLVSNALKFTEQGEVSVTIGAADPGLVIKVRDTGIGIPADRLDQLFEKFEQADASTTRRFGGTGLGLSICRDLAKLMNGAVTVESVLGEGTCFTAVLPLPRLSGEVAEKVVEPAAAHIPPQDTGDETALRVLAAEDNAVNQLVLRTMLQQAGIEPTIVADGRAAVEAWETGDWDIILMDVHMPVMDGVSATRLIRQREAVAGRPHTPILALTANAMSHQVAEYTASGMDGFVAKPIEISRLFAAIEAAVSEQPDSSGVSAAG